MKIKNRFSVSSVSSSFSPESIVSGVAYAGILSDDIEAFLFRACKDIDKSISFKIVFEPELDDGFFWKSNIIISGKADVKDFIYDALSDYYACGGCYNDVVFLSVLFHRVINSHIAEVMKISIYDGLNSIELSFSIMDIGNEWDVRFMGVNHERR